MILRLPERYLEEKVYLERIVGKMEKFKITNNRASDSNLPPWDNRLYRYSFYISRLAAKLLLERSVDTEIAANEIKSEIGFINIQDFNAASRQLGALLGQRINLGG